MKLVQKKCPNCGASLSFNESDTNVTCEYCKQSFYIEKDEKETKKGIDISADAYNLVKSAEPVVKSVAIAHVVVSIVVFVVIAIGFVLVFSLIFSQVFGNDDKEKIDTSNDNNYSINSGISDVDDTKKEDNSLKEISQISEESLKDIEEQSLSILDKFDDLGGTSYKVVNSWSRVGFYLLLPKDNGYIELYDIYKITYKNGSKNITLYAAVEYKDMEYKDGGVISSFGGYPDAPVYNTNKADYGFIYGYDSLESYYNKNIKSKKNSYDIKASDGLYMEE